MEEKEKKANEYADKLPYYQDRRLHAAEDYLAGWSAADSFWREDKENIPDNEFVLVLHMGCPMCMVGSYAKVQSVVRYWRNIPRIPDDEDIICDDLGV